MASRSGDRLHRPPVARLLARLRPPEPAAFAALAANAASAGRRGRAIVSAETGRLIEALAACRPDGRILELGCGAGDATFWLAKGARQAAIVASDQDREAIELAKAALDGAGLGARIEWWVEPARVAIERAAAPLDLIVIDGMGDDPRRLVDLALPKLAVGGRMAILGALRDLADAALEPAAAAALERLRPYVLIHPQLASSLIPLGEGVLVGVKRRETIRELGGPF